MSFDQIIAEGYDVITPIIVCNTGDYSTFNVFVDKDVVPGDCVIELAK